MKQDVFLLRLPEGSKVIIIPDVEFQPPKCKCRSIARSFDGGANADYTHPYRLKQLDISGR